MKSILKLLSAPLLLTCVFSQAQVRTDSANTKSKPAKGRIGISIPVIYNSSQAVYYQTGNRNTSTGNAISTGINLIYFKPVLNHVFLNGGIGYFVQNFKIERPFNFEDPTALLFRTKDYSYESLNFKLGIGVDKKLTDKLRYEIALSYLSLYSFKQQYTPTFLSNSSTDKKQVNSKFFHVGDFLSFELGVLKKLSSKLSVGGHLVYPILVYWDKDPIFINSNYSAEELKIAENKFSAGLSISAYYHF